MDSMRCVKGAPWAFIAVMGVTGAGKSSFIKDLTNDDTVNIGHDLVSCTAELKGYTFHHGGFNINLIDTPGFNDTTRPENEVLRDIAEWLERLYQDKQRLTGIIYLHNIEHPRMEGSALRNLMMFRKLCGDKPLENVILATTFWGKVDPSMAEKRENELRTTPDFWGQMLQKGSRVERYRNREDGLHMMDILLQKKVITLEIQHEMVDQAKPLGETQAGQAVNEELTRLEAKHRADTQQLKKEMEEAIKNHDKEMQENLKAQQERVDREINKINLQREQLNAERRAERREMMNDHEAQVRLLKKMQNDSLQEAVEKIRVKESRIAAEDREILEKKIAELETKLKQGKKKRSTGRYLYMALRAIFPAATLALLGIPLTLPGMSDSAGDEPDSITDNY